ncbi:MAG: CC0125/CC1285 family lipoprotein [Geminicoccaceae bacterium]|jgi:hypothetical protein
MQRYKLGIAILIAAVLGACAKPTVYKPAGHEGANGYAEREIGADQYRISFAGNGLTTRKTVDLYLLYRAAELTQEKGFDYFIVGQRQDFIDPQGIGGRQSQISFARRQELLIGSGIRARFGEEVVDQYGAEIDILMQKGEKPDSPNVYKAIDVIEESEGAIIRPKSQV